MHQTVGEIAGGVSTVPLDDGFADSRLALRVGNRDLQAARIDQHCRHQYSVSNNIQRQATAKKVDLFAIGPALLARLVIGPLVELFQNPVCCVEHRAFYSGFGRVPRRRDDQPVGVDTERNCAAAAGALEHEINIAVAEHRVLRSLDRINRE